MAAQRRELAIAFVDFWLGFDPHRNAFVALLEAHFRVRVVAPADADLLVCSKHGQSHRRFRGTKLHYTAENLRPRRGDADFHIGFDHLDRPRYLRLPYFALLAVEDELWPPPRPTPPTPWAERAFCAFIHSHAGPPARRQLYDALAAYRPVTSPGRYLNNVVEPALAPRRGDWRASKIDYLQRFRFVIACENSAFPGYTTEKLYDALLAGAVPVYWGDPLVERDFDPGAFVHCRDYASFEEVAAVVRRLDADPDSAAAYLHRAPGLRVPTEQWRARLETFLVEAAEEALAGRRVRHHLRAARLLTKQRVARRAAQLRHRLRSGG